MEHHSSSMPLRGETAQGASNTGPSNTTDSPNAKQCSAANGST